MLSPHADVIVRFKERLTVLSSELKVCAKRPGEALLKTATIFVEAVRRHVEGMASLEPPSSKQL